MLYLLKDSIPTQIFGVKCERDQAAISNARWKEGRKETKVDLPIFSSFTTSLLLFVLLGENMRRVKIPPNPTNMAC